MPLGPGKQGLSEKPSPHPQRRPPSVLVATQRAKQGPARRGPQVTLSHRGERVHGWEGGRRFTSNPWGGMGSARGAADRAKSGRGSGTPLRKMLTDAPPSTPPQSPPPPAGASARSAPPGVRT